MTTTPSAMPGVSGAPPVPPAPGADLDHGGQVPGVGARHRRGAAAKLWLVLIVVLTLLATIVGAAMFVNRWTQQRQERAAAAKADRAKAYAQPAEATVRDFAAEKSRMESGQAGLPMPAAAMAGTSTTPGLSGAGQPVVRPAYDVAAEGVTAPGQRPDAGPVQWYSGVVLATNGPQSTLGAAGLPGSAVRSAVAAVRPAPNGNTEALAEQDGFAASLAQAGRMAQALQDTSGMTGSLAGTPPDGDSSDVPDRPDALDAKLRPSRAGRAATVKARLLPDPTHLLAQGTMVPCIVSRIVTTYPGMVTCTLMQDVYSANGRMLLLRKGATAIGEQKTALMQGQARVFALWTSIDDGRVTLQLDSPATDPQGGSGIPAWTDAHFWERFGGAMLVSFLGDVGQAMSQPSAARTGSTVVLGGASSTASTLAEETLKNTINIPPTGYVDQGAVVHIYVARHVDFGEVYELQRR